MAPLPELNEEREMGVDGNEILLLGIGIQPLWKLVDQRLETDKKPHELHLEVKAERGSRYACPECGQSCAAHDFKEKTWRHLNFFQHHRYIHASVPRVKCPEHGVRAVGLDETAAKRGQHYVTVFIDMERQTEPVLFATPGRGKDCLQQFAAFLEQHQGNPKQILEVVCDMSPAFLSGIAEHLPEAEVTVDWFHIVQVFTRAVDDMRKSEGRFKPLPKHLRWAVLKRGDATHLTTSQLYALAELVSQGLDTATAWKVKEKLAWVREAQTPQAARWRITRYLNYSRTLIGDGRLLEPVRKALCTLENHIEQVVRRWTSTYTNARL